jgi:hypothetical protein
MMTRFSLLFFLMTGWVVCSFSQSEFFRRGRSGVEGGLGINFTSEANSALIFAGYSYRGFLEASLQYSKASGGKVRDGVLTPSIAYYPLKQEDAKNAPTLGLSLGFSHYTTKTVTTVIVPIANAQSRIDTLINVSSVNALKLGVTAAHRMGYWKMLFFQPTFGAEMSLVKSGWEVAVRGGVAIGMRIGRGPLLIFTPSIERQSGLTAFVCTCGMVF